MSASYGEWLAAVFDHPDPDWYWADHFDTTWSALGMTDDRTVEYLTRLFSEPAVLRAYTLGQVAQGIWFLIGESSPAGPAGALVQPAVPLDRRVACIHAIPTFFRGYVAAVAPGPSRHLSDPFHIACYMWWDIFPVSGQQGGNEPEIDKACLSAMAQVLAIPSDVCRISALHGLNHWRLFYTKETTRTIDDFLQAPADLSAFVREYAAVARTGQAQ